MTNRDADLRRLARALYLDVTEMGLGRFRVSGGAEPHMLQKHSDGMSCDCVDYATRGGLCKHVLAVRLVSGDRKLLRALRLLIPYPQSQKVGAS